MRAELQRADSCPVINVNQATGKPLTCGAHAQTHLVKKGLLHAEDPAGEVQGRHFYTLK